MGISYIPYHEVSDVYQILTFRRVCVLIESSSFIDNIFIMILFTWCVILDSSYTHICSDGVSRTGAFCTLYSVLERVKVDQVVDVYLATKTLRIQRAGLLETLVR